MNEREYSGQNLKDFVIQPIGQGDAIPSVRITLWPELSHADVKKGDFVAAQGKFTVERKGDKVYYNLSASDFAHNGVTVAKSTDVVENPVEEEDEDFDPGF